MAVYLGSNKVSPVKSIGEAVSVIESLDSNGHTVLDINAVDLSQDTVDSSHLEYGYTAHNKNGNLVTGTMIPGEVLEINPLAVDFVDYDGTLLYTYSATDFANLSALPTNPSHGGLIAQGWNWTLTDAKTHVAKYGSLVIGQNYTTTDGKTRVYVEVTNFELPYEFGINFQYISTGQVTIDWGDGTIVTPQATVGNNCRVNHKYSEIGSYVISLNVDSCTIKIGYNGANCGFLYHNSIDTQITRRCIKKIEIGNNITTFDRQCFQQLVFLETISIPTTITTINDITTVDSNMFANCRNLKCIVFPSDITYNKPANLATGCYNLKYVSLPKDEINCTSCQNLFSDALELKKLTIANASVMTTSSVISPGYNLKYLTLGGTWTSIGSYAFRDGYSHLLNALIIPSTVTSIGNYAFSGSYIKEVHMEPTTPPTAGNANIFTKFPELVIYVPKGSLEDYLSATNWSTYSSYLQEES